METKDPCLYRSGAVFHGRLTIDVNEIMMCGIFFIAQSNMKITPYFLLKIFTIAIDCILLQICSNFSRSAKPLIFSVPSNGKSLVVSPVYH